MRGTRRLAFAAGTLLFVGSLAGTPAFAGGATTTDGPFDNTACAGLTEPTDECPTSGNGQGKAPHVAGSKGNADDKNPPGQVKKWLLTGDPNTEPDAGYECDDNSGIAKGNPAHSGCTSGEGGGEGSD
jgi:hypothetical protein